MAPVRAAEEQVEKATTVIDEMLREVAGEVLAARAAAELTGTLSIV